MCAWRRCISRVGQQNYRRSRVGLCHLAGRVLVWPREGFLRVHQQQRVGVLGVDQGVRGRVHLDLGVAQVVHGGVVLGCVRAEAQDRLPKEKKDTQCEPQVFFFERCGDCRRRRNAQ